MNKSIKETLKKIPRSRCTKCNSQKSYTNPLARCKICMKNYCYNHIHGGQYLEGMKETDLLVDLCEKCVLSSDPTSDLG